MSINQINVRHKILFTLYSILFTQTAALVILVINNNKKLFNSKIKKRKITRNIL